MSDYYENGTNAGIGMVPCKKNCHCSDCQIESLQTQLAEARVELEKVNKQADKSRRLVDAANEIIGNPTGALRLEAAESELKELREGVGGLIAVLSENNGGTYAAKKRLQALLKPEVKDE